jgi:hypothetical protein
MREGIEHLERWLDSIDGPAAEVDAAAIKQQVRLAVREQWLAEGLVEEERPGLADRVKAAVRATIAAERGPAAHPRARRARIIRWSMWTGLGLSAAAVLALALWPTLNPSGDDAGESIVDVYAAVFAESEPDGLDRELDELRAAFDELDATVAGGWMDDETGDDGGTSPDSGESELPGHNGA